MQYVVRLLVSFLLALPLTASCAEFNTAIPDTIISSLEKLEGPERADETLNQARSCLGSNPQLCRNLLQEAIRYSNLINYDEGLARAYNGMGSVLNMVGDNSRGLEYFQRSLEKYKLLDDEAGQAKTLQNISTMQSSMELYVEALETGEQALRLREKLGDEGEIAKSLAALAVNNRDLGNDLKALELSHRCLKLKRKLDDQAGIAIGLSTMGTIQIKLGMQEEALASHLEAVNLSRDLGNLYYLGTALCNLGTTYIQTEKWNLAVEAAEDALVQGEKTGVLSIQENAHNILAHAFEGLGLNEKALWHFHSSKHLKDEIYSDEMARRISALTSQIETSRNRNRLLELERDQITARLDLEQKRAQRNIFLVGFSLSLPLAILAFLLFRRSVAANRDLTATAKDLAEAMENMKTLRGLIPICASCKSVRDDKGYWHQVETYVMDHSEAEFSHGICPDCKEMHYGDLLKS